jgi:hypothetical protein
MAIDQRRGASQVYRLCHDSSGAYLDFFSPLPLWAERRLAVLGHLAAKEKCLFSYWVPECELASEQKFLQARLWLDNYESPKKREAE